MRVDANEVNSVILGISDALLPTHVKPLPQAFGSVHMSRTHQSERELMLPRHDIIE